MWCRSRVMTALRLATSVAVALAVPVVGPSGPANAVTVDRGLSAQLPKDFEPAPRLDDVHREIGWTAKDVERLAVDSAASANKQLLNDVAAASGRPADSDILPDPVEASDLVSYLIKGSHAGDYTIITAEQGAAVGKDGIVYQPAAVAGSGKTDMSENRLAQLPPEFEGPWFDPTYRMLFYRITRGQDASWWNDWPFCDGRVEFKMGVWTHSVRLGDNSVPLPDEDFFGLWRTLAAERTRGTGGVQCKDLLRSLESTIRLWEEEMEYLTSSDWVAKDPLSFPSSGECTTTELNVSTPISGGREASIGTTFEHCERWDTTGASAGNAYEYYGIKYDFGGNCHARARSGHYLMVVRTNYRSDTTFRLIRPGFQYTHDLIPDQEPPNSLTCL